MSKYSVEFNSIEFGFTTVVRAALQKLERQILPLKYCTSDPTVRPIVLWGSFSHLVRKEYCPHMSKDRFNSIVSNKAKTITDGLQELMENPQFQDGNIFECELKDIPNVVNFRIAQANAVPNEDIRSSRMEDLIDDLMNRIIKEVKNLK